MCVMGPQKLDVKYKWMAALLGWAEPGRYKVAQNFSLFLGYRECPWELSVCPIWLY